MKTKMNTLVAFALTAVLSVVFGTVNANPADSTLKATTVKEELPSFEYIGKLEEQPVFKFNLDNAAAYTVVVKGENGDVIFRDVYTSNINSKKFLLSSDAFSYSQVRFEVTSRKDNSTHVFEVKLSEEDNSLIVTKVK